MGPISAASGVMNVAELIYNFGPAIVIVSIFLMLFIIVLFYIMRQQQKMNENTMKEHQLLLDSLIKRGLEEKHHAASKAEEKNLKEIMNIYIKISSHLKVELSSFMSSLEAERLGIYLFHNGMHAPNGFPFFKFSCISEQVKHINLAKIKQHHDFPVNLMSDFIKDLYTHQEIAYYDEGQSSFESDALFNKLISDQHNKYIAKGIFDTNVNLIGFVIVEFSNKLLDTNNYAHKNAKIDQLVKTISPILEFSDFNNLYQGGVN